MKKAITFLLALALLFGLCACAQPSAAAPASAQTAPTPTPQPEGMEKVFGKDVAIACDAPEDGLFAQGLRAQAERTGIPVSFVSEVEAAEKCDALIHFQNEELDPQKVNVPYITLIHDSEKDENAVGLIVYKGSEEIDAALKTMFEYPSHEAPVRILGLFSQADSEAAKAYDAMVSEGKLQSKGTFVGSDGLTAKAWLAETLPGIGVGVLDTVFAETPELAMEGYAALRQADRNDAVEICAAGLTQAQIEAMQEEHFLMGSAVGLDEYNAGMLALRMCAGILAGENVDTPVEIEPFALCSDEVRALQKQDVTDIGEVMERLNGSLSGICDFAFLKELAEYYGA